jgi:hypothetical protein
MAFRESPMASRRMNVIDGLHLALDYTAEILLRPFDAIRWLLLGVIVFMTQLSSGGGSGFNIGNPFGGVPGSGGGFEPKDLERMLEGFIANALWVVIAAVVVLIFLALGILFIWLGSRAEIMLVDCLALNRVRLGDSWKRSAEPGWSLFLFRLVVSIIVGIIVLSFAIVGIIILFSAETSASWAFLAVPFFLVSLPLIAFLFLLRVFLINFVVPLMYHLDLSCLEAWKHFGVLASGNLWPLAGFLGIKIIISIVTGVLSVLVIFLTCCIGALPVIHQALTAPLHVFNRAYSLFVLESLGPEYRIIQPESPPRPWDVPDEEEDAQL